MGRTEDRPIDSDRVVCVLHDKGVSPRDPNMVSTLPGEYKGKEIRLKESLLLAVK